MIRVNGLILFIFFDLTNCLSAAETFRFDRSWPLLPQPCYMAPSDVAIDTKGNVYVLDALNAKIQKYSPDGNVQGVWGKACSNAPCTNSRIFQTEWDVPKPMGLAIDREGNVFVGDIAHFGLHKYSETGVFLWFGGGYGYEQGKFWQFGGFALNDQGDIYVAGLLLGRIQKFDKDKNYFGSNEQISASEIKTSLDALQNDPAFDGPGDQNDRQVYVIYDACESGSFIAGLTPSASKKRVIITSTSPGERAAFISNGAVSFSNYFWNDIFKGADIKTSFQSAKIALAASSTEQIPMMDANGDRSRNITDLTQMTGVSIENGTSVNSDAPTMGTVDTSVSGNMLTVTTTVTNPSDIGRVFVVVRPPDLLDNSTTNPVQGFPNFNLLPVSEGSNKFSGKYDALSASGNYEFAVYASNKLGNMSLPQLKTVNVSGTKPRKAILAAGGELSDANWQAISTNAQLA